MGKKDDKGYVAIPRAEEPKTGWEIIKGYAEPFQMAGLLDRTFRWMTTSEMLGTQNWEGPAAG